MGQFYKGTEASYLEDAMYKLPYELMGQVIAKKDKEVETAVEATSSLSSLLQAKGLKADDPRLQEIIGGYTGQISDISTGIYGDAMNAAQYTPKIEALKKQITSDWKMGEVSKIEGNLAAYNTWEEETKKQIEKAGNKITPQQWELLKAKKLQEFKGTNYQDSLNYNTFTGEALLEKKPADVFLDDIFKEKVGKVKSISWDNDKGNWRVAGERGTEGFTDAELRQAYATALMADPNQIQALNQLNTLGVPGYQEELFDKNGLIIDPARPNALSRELDYAKQKYGIVSTKTSNTQLVSDIGKQEHAYEIKQRDEEQPVGFLFKDTVKQPITSDYNTYNHTKKTIIDAKNQLFGTIANKLGLKTPEARAKLGQQIGRGDYSAFAGIPDSAGYEEQFRDLFAKQTLQNEVEKDYNSWVNSKKKDNKGRVVTTNIINGKKVTNLVDPHSSEGKNQLFNMYTRQPGFQQNVPVDYIADNISAGIGIQATKAIGKVLGDNLSSLSLTFHTAKDKQTLYTNVDGKTKARLVSPRDITTNLKKAQYTDGKMYAVDKDGTFLLPILNPDGSFLAQNLVNLGLATDLHYNASTTEGGEGEDALGEIILKMYGSKNNMVFKTGSARVVDRNINGRTALALPVSGGDFNVIASVDANVIQQPDLQRYINDPGRKANQKFNDWNTMVPPTLSPKIMTNGTSIGKDPKKGWYLQDSKGKAISPAEGGTTQEKLAWAYYNKTRQH